MISCKAAIKAGDRLTPRKSPRCWSSGTWPRTRITARTAGPRPWSSPAKNSTGNSSGKAEVECALADVCCLDFGERIVHRLKGHLRREVPAATVIRRLHRFRRWERTVHCL